MTNKYDGYKWIKVKHLPPFKYEGDKFYDVPYSGDSYHSGAYVLALEEHIEEMEEHHIEETTFLIEEIRKLAKQLEEKNHEADRGD